MMRKSQSIERIEKLGGKGTGEQWSLRLIVLMLLVLMMGSCVSNKQITYLQYGDELSNSKEIPTDSIIRKYDTGELRYTLQPNDIVSIRIATTTPEEYNPFLLADPNLSSGGRSGSVNNIGSSGNASIMGYKVDPWGNLNLPVIGQLKVQGLSVEKLEELVDSLAGEELEDPISKISLINFKYSVMGEIAGDGVYNSSEQSLTMMQAIANAGGPDEFGDLSRLKVIRKIGDETFVFYVNVLEENFLTSDFYYVFPNDMIIIPPLKSRIYFNYISPNIAIFSSVMSFTASIIALIAVFGGSNGS